jgi:hypothetical protein
MLILNTGTQYVEGDLSFDPGFQIFLYDSVFSQTGDYVLFDYSLGSFSGGQSELDNNVSVTAVDLKLSYLNPLGGVAVLENQPEHNRVVVKLLSKPENGKQWVEGDLNFAGPTTIYLDQHLFTTPGTYELFEVTGNIYNVENLTAIHDGGFLIGTPFVDPLDDKKVKINLVKAIGINNANVSQSYAIAPEIVQLTKTIHLSLSQTVVSSVISPAIIPTLLIGTSAVSSYAYEPLIEQKASLETAVATAYSMSPDVIQGLSTQTCSSLSYVFDPSFKINIGSETASVIAFAFSPAVEQKIQTNVSITLNSTFSPAVIQKCLIAGSAVVETSCIDPITKRVSTPSSVGSACFNPALEQKISLSTTSVVSSVFRLRMGIGESNWYSYFPMACFDGSISIDSTFKIMILGEESIFNADQRYISDVPGHLNGISKNITLKNVYINNIGDVVYDFDSVTFEQQDFVFQNAVIYANNYLVLHINWARDFSLIDQTVTIDVPEVNAIARPIMPFGTLELEPYIRDPATVFATAINPAFPFVYPDVAIAYSFAFTPNPVRLEPECSFADATAFNPDVQFELDEIEDGPDIIELTEDEGFAEAYCIAFDPFAIQILVLDFTPVVAKAFVPIGPPQEITLDEISYSSAFAFNPILETQLRLACATAYAASYQSSAKYILNIDTAIALSVSICPPVVYQEPVEELPVIQTLGDQVSKCVDPFYEMKERRDPRQKSSISELTGYWKFDGSLRDSSYSRNDLKLISEDSEINSPSLYDTGIFDRGFRGFTQKNVNIYSDYIVANQFSECKDDFSVQLWFKVDHDEVLIDKRVSLVEQMNWCWGGSGPSFPGSVGWSLHSVADDQDITFQFNIIDAKTRLTALASLTINDQFIVSQKWHHIVGTRSGNEISVYVDGIKFGDGVGERILEGDLDPDHSFDLIEDIPMIIGSTQLGLSSPLLKSYSTEELDDGDKIQNDAVIDEVATWKKTLNQKEVDFLWLGGIGNIASDLPAPLYTIDTARIDSLRQGVELTQQKHFALGNYKVYSGDRKSHRWIQNVFGLTPPRREECFGGFEDKSRFDSLEYVTNTTFNAFQISDEPIRDGVIRAFNGSASAVISTDIFQTVFMVGQYPNLPYEEGVNESDSAPIRPFDDNVDNLPQIGGLVPYEYRSQSTGYDYNARNSPGTDSIAFGGINY